MPNGITPPDITFNAYGLRLNVTPGIPEFAPHSKLYDLNLVVRPIRVELERAFRQLSRELLEGSIESFFDDDRELRTLLNFGDDRQVLLTNWMLDPNNRDRNAILVKLYEPLPAGFSRRDQLWISREITPPLLEQINVVFRPAALVPIYLRPRNENLDIFVGHEVNQTSLDTIFPSGAVNIPSGWPHPDSGSVTLQESALERLYSIDAGSAELNIDYAAWSNFIHFSSAKRRLEIFREKLQQVEALTTIINNQLDYASGAYAATETAGDTPLPLESMSVFPELRSNLEERQSLIRSFDGYEKFLYYETGSLSASLSGDDDEDLILYQPTASWPKDNSLNPLPTTNSIAESWFNTQSILADEYDGQNQNWLQRVVPNYLLDDNDSDAYLTFVDMVGHHFDLVKNYIDQMTQIYDRDPSFERGLSKDLIWHIGKSLGLEFPHISTVLSAAGLSDWGVSAGSSSYLDTYRDATQESWKRFLHSHIYLMKTKGTEESFRTLSNIYGLPYETLRLKTSMHPSTNYVLNPSDLDTAAFETFDESNYVLPFTSGTHLELAFSSSLIDIKTVEMRFSVSGSASGTLLVAGNGTAPDWSVEIVPETVTSSWTSRESVKKAKFVVKDSAGSWVATSAIDNIFNNGYFTLMLRNTGSTYDFTVAQHKSETFRYFSGPHAITTGSFTGSWLADSLFVGGSGSEWFTGSVDEVRVWSEPIRLPTFRNHVKFPGLYGGETTASARERLVWRLSFNKPQNMATTASYPNESPFLTQYTGSTPISASVANGFSGSLTFPHSFLKIRRETQRFSPNAGGSVYSTNRVTIAPTASVTRFPTGMLKSTGSTTWPVLSREKTIRSYDAEAKAGNRLALYASLAETINDSILRSVGQSINMHNLLGDPLNVQRTEYPDLAALNEYYADNYRPATMSYQTLARNVDGILEGIFKAAKMISPASARLLSGIVIEPPILERTKTRFVREVVTDGPTRRNIVSSSILLAESGSLPSTWNLEARIINTRRSATSSIYSMSADEASYFSTVGAAPTATLDDSTYITYFDPNPLIASSSLSMSAILPYFTGTAEYPTASFQASYDTYSASIAASASTLTGSKVGGAAAALNGGNFMVEYVEPMDLYPYSYWKSGEIAPQPDRFTYFTHVSGSYGVRRLVRQRTLEKILTDKGTWVQGAEYKENDVVTQQGQTGSAAAGNGVEFRCLTSFVLVTSGTVDHQRRANFVSNKPPSVDPDNWIRVRYKLTETILPWTVVQSGSAFHANDLKKATLVPYSEFSESQVTTESSSSMSRTETGLLVFDDFNRTDVWTTDEPWLDSIDPVNATTASITGDPEYVIESGGTNAAKSSIYRLIDPTEEYIVQSNSRHQTQAIFGKTSGSVSASAGVPQRATFVNLSGGPASSSWGFYLEGSAAFNNWRLFHREQGTTPQLITVGGHTDDTAYNTTRIVFRRADASNVSMSIYRSPDSTLPNILSASFAASNSVVHDITGEPTASTFTPGFAGSPKEMIGMSWGNRDNGAARHAMFIACGVDIIISGSGIVEGFTASLVSGSTEVTSSTFHTSSMAMPIDNIPLPLTKVVIYDSSGTELTQSVHTDGVWGGDTFNVDVESIGGEGVPYVIVQGYTEHHYKFFRDTTTPYNRIRYNGVLQTADTTIDGGPAAESKLSSEAQLIVQDGTPIRRDKDEEGPILDVD